MRGQLLCHYELWGTLPQATHLRKLIYLLRKTNTLLCKTTIKLYTNYISFTLISMDNRGILGAEQAVKQQHKSTIALVCFRKN